MRVFRPILDPPETSCTLDWGYFKNKTTSRSFFVEILSQQGQQIGLRLDIINYEKQMSGREE
jgi:hypothetical protein